MGKYSVCCTPSTACNEECCGEEGHAEAVSEVSPPGLTFQAFSSRNKWFG